MQNICVYEAGSPPSARLGFRLLNARDEFGDDPVRLAASYAQFDDLGGDAGVDEPE